VSGTGTGTTVDEKAKNYNYKKSNNVYGAGEGYPSTGVVAGGKTGPAALSSSNRGQPGVSRQAPECVHATGERDTRAGGSQRGSEKPGVMTGLEPSRSGMRRRRGGDGGVRSGDEKSSGSFSSDVTGALGKRLFCRITASTEDAASAANGRGVGAVRCTRRGDTSVGDSDSTWLPVPDKRKKRGAKCGAGADTDTGAEPLPSTMVPTAATKRKSERSTNK
jgi:hypothetical protein